MYPDLIDLGFLHLKTYGACMAIGFIVCWKLVEVLSGRKDLSNLLVSLMISGVVGSRIAYVIEHWTKEFSAHPGQIVAVWNGGLMFYGGLILAIIVFFIWCYLKKEDTFKLADLLATVIPLGHAFGRIGCFFYGCCYGRDSDAWCAVVFPVHSPCWYEHGMKSVPVLPTQLFEAAALLLLFAVLLYHFIKTSKRPDGQPSSNVSFYLIGYAIIRFGIEYMRGDPRAVVGPLSISQTISIVMIVLGIALFEIRKRRSK